VKKSLTFNGEKTVFISIMIFASSVNFYKSITPKEILTRDTADIVLIIFKMIYNSEYEYLLIIASKRISFKL